MKLIGRYSTTAVDFTALDVENFTYRHSATDVSLLLYGLILIDLLCALYEGYCACGTILILVCVI